MRAKEEILPRRCKEERTYRCLVSRRAPSYRHVIGTYRASKLKAITVLLSEHFPALGPL